MHLNLFVSQRCFIYCKGCYSYSREESCGQMLETNVIINFLKYAYSNGIKKVTICGGDPLTRPDIIDLLKQIKNIGYYISLDTLGTSILRDVKLDSKTIVTKTNVEDIANLVNMIGIPIDGSSNEIFRKFRCTKTKILEDQITICNELSKYGANICINTVLHKENIDDIFKIAEIVNLLSYIKKWQIFQFQPFGKYGKLNKNIFEISEDKFNEIKEKILIQFNNNKKIQFKSSTLRNRLYMLVDNSGNAFISSICNSKGDDRKIIGNIKNENDWFTIVKYLKS